MVSDGLQNFCNCLKNFFYKIKLFKSYKIDLWLKGVKCIPFVTGGYDIVLRIVREPLNDLYAKIERNEHKTSFSRV